MYQNALVTQKKNLLMNKIIQLVIISFCILNVSAQSIDKVEAIIGDEIVLKSDIESQYIQFLSQGNIKSNSIKCEIIEDLLFQKLLVNQAKIDSVIISDEDIDSEIKKRLDYFESQLGSLEKVEEYFNKSKSDIELELGKVIQDQFKAQQVQTSITSNLHVTPAEVKDFLKNKMYLNYLLFLLKLK